MTLLPLLAAAALLGSSLVVYGLAMHFVVRVVVRLTRTGHGELTFWGSTAVMAIVTLIVSAGHLTQIVLWALAYRMGGEMPTLGTAVYFSALSYTALGAEGVALSDPWKFHGPLEAMEGAVFFGLSTAVLFTIMNHLIADRLRLETGYQADASGYLSLPPVAEVGATSPSPVPILQVHGGPPSSGDRTDLRPGSTDTPRISEGALG